jgi:hypothetical protein
MADFHLTPVDDDSKWDQFVDRSPQGTIFSCSDYLAKAGCKFSRHYICRGTARRAGLVLALSDDGKNCILDDHIIYNGVLLLYPDKDQNQVQKISDEFEILSYISEELPKRFSKVEIALAPQIKDLRPFLWRNYKGNEDQKWKLDLRYTSYINLNGINSVSEAEIEQNLLFKNLGKTRRQEIRYARRNGVFAKTSKDFGPFLDLYQETMNVQELECSSEDISNKRDLLEHLQQIGKVKQFIIENPNGEVVSSAIFCYDKKRAYYLFGGNHPDAKSSYSGTIVLWDAFRDLNKSGIEEVDLEGVNSPKRGWFKINMGGNLLPYYQVYFGN